MDQTVLNRVKKADRIAGLIIRFGGLTIIMSVVGILLLIVNEAFPLFKDADSEVRSVFKIPVQKGTAEVKALGMDGYLETGFVFDSTGNFSFFRTVDGKKIDETSLPQYKDSGIFIMSAEGHENLTYSLLWSDASLSIIRIKFYPSFDQEGNRSILHRVETIKIFPPHIINNKMPERSIARISEEGTATRVSLFGNGVLSINRETLTTDIFGNEESETSSFFIKENMPGGINALILDSMGETLYAGTSEGFILKWDLSGQENIILTDKIRVSQKNDAVTSLALVLGDLSLAVGTASGELSTWFPVNEWSGDRKKLRKAHTLFSHDTAIIKIIPTLRDKSLLSLSEDGTASFDHTTSENHLFAIKGSKKIMAGLSAKGNGLIALDETGMITTWSINNPHPEISLTTLFGKIWYEGFSSAEYIWQSSSGSDDFEPKLSLVPLIFGSIKGTLYAMLIAIPLSIGGALYTSQFTSGTFQGIIKPVVEIMAAVPSVVIGFLAALWLAPAVAKSILSLMLTLCMIPALFLILILIVQTSDSYISYAKTGKNYEFLILIPVLMSAFWFSSLLQPVIESFLFEGDFKLWLFQDAGTRYDQRNCAVIAFALGMTVIPIIFTIAEDALSNVPSSLKAASLALGASRWQTVWRVILPSASPGIFAGAIIGFGRAVGETMIVLMATGNTPIMEWSIFNGMRTLSANIAVEISEAPVDGTLYRVLFLSAVLLFLLTFTLNTSAELVRQFLRRKYARYE